MYYLGHKRPLDMISYSSIYMLGTKLVRIHSVCLYMYLLCLFCVCYFGLTFLQSSCIIALACFSCCSDRKYKWFDFDFDFEFTGIQLLYINVVNYQQKTESDTFYDECNRATQQNVRHCASWMNTCSMKTGASVTK